MPRRCRRRAPAAGRGQHVFTLGTPHLGADLREGSQRAQTGERAARPARRASLARARQRAQRGHQGPAVLDPAAEEDWSDCDPDEYLRDRCQGGSVPCARRQLLLRRRDAESRRAARISLLRRPPRANAPAPRGKATAVGSSIPFEVDNGRREASTGSPTSTCSITPRCISRSGPGLRGARSDGPSQPGRRRHAAAFRSLGQRLLPPPVGDRCPWPQSRSRFGAVSGTCVAPGASPTRTRLRSPGAGVRSPSSGRAKGTPSSRSCFSVRRARAERAPKKERGSLRKRFAT